MTENRNVRVRTAKKKWTISNCNQGKIKSNNLNLMKSTEFSELT